MSPLSFASQRDGVVLHRAFDIPVSQLDFPALVVQGRHLSCAESRHGQGGKDRFLPACHLIGHCANFYQCVGNAGFSCEPEARPSLQQTVTVAIALKFRGHTSLAFRDEPVTVAVFSLNTQQQVGTEEAFIQQGH